MTETQSEEIEQGEREPDMFPKPPEKIEGQLVDFDWNGREVIIRSQPATAIYFNRHGHVVIRQEVGWPEDDCWITLDPRHLPDVIDQLEQMKREAWK